MPELSIVVPVYNVHTYLRKCVGSILSQDYTDFEVLLVDDGSTDGSAGICDEFAANDARVRVFHKPNGGVSSARNYGIDRIKGRYLIFADADDWFSEHSFSILMEGDKLHDLTYYGSVFHYDNHEKYRSPGAFSYFSPMGLQRGLVLLANNKQCPDYIGFTWNKVFKVSIIREYGLRFVEGLSIREDEIFTLHYAMHCKSMATLPDLLYHYRKHPFGLTALKSKVNDLRLLVRCFKDMESRFSDEVLRDYISGQVVRFLLHAVRVCKEKDERRIIIWDLWRYVQERRHCHLPVKPFYKSLLLLPSCKPLQILMDARFLYYRLKKGKTAFI